MGKKRKDPTNSKQKFKKRCRSSFIEEECEASSDEEGDEDEEEGDSDLEGLIDDPSLHRAFDNEMDSAINESVAESEDGELSSDEDGDDGDEEESGLTKLEEKRLKRLKSARSSLVRY